MGTRSQGNRVHTCKVCGGEFRRWVDAATYCSRGCMTVDYRERNAAEGNPSWRGGKWKYKGRQWARIAGEAIARDGRCADCGTTEGLLAHHLIPQRFWIDLDTANGPDNLLTLCSPCHVKRPEHYWVTLPDEHRVDGVHLAEPPERTRARLRPYPDCATCGNPCKTHRARFCSYTCSNRARWQSGLYDPGAITRNLGPGPARARWNRE